MSRRELTDIEENIYLKAIRQLKKGLANGSRLINYKEQVNEANIFLFNEESKAFTVSINIEFEVANNEEEQGE